MNWPSWLLVLDNCDAMGGEDLFCAVLGFRQEGSDRDIGSVKVGLNPLDPMGNGPGPVLDRACNENIHRRDSTLET